MTESHDGPASKLFRAIRIQGNTTLGALAQGDVSQAFRDRWSFAPTGKCTAWGMPFLLEKVLVCAGTIPRKVVLKVAQARWLVFMHTTEYVSLPSTEKGIPAAFKGEGRLGEHVADYVVLYADGTEARIPVLRRRNIGMLARNWGENCFEAVSFHKPHPLRNLSEQSHVPGVEWGQSQALATVPDLRPWMYWLYAWENPCPDMAIVGLRVEPKEGMVILAGLAAGTAQEHPLRWQMRQKAVFDLPKGVAFDPAMDEAGTLRQFRLDLGQVISAIPQRVYPNATWGKAHNNQIPIVSEDKVLVEYTAHPEACFHLFNGRTVPLSQVEAGTAHTGCEPVPPARHRVQLRVLDETSGRPVPVKLHLHGRAGEYLAPLDRQRRPNAHWFEDYGSEFVGLDVHDCAYINGETLVDLPAGEVYVEISKGFEIAPIHQVLKITPATKTLTIKVKKVLPWREKGWVTADTHVHFLSPMTALLEGEAEGVNIVNLLASQWGDLMTNAGDFDGKNTWGSRETGGDGEYMVRVGTENRQHVMGHISLLGYKGNVISPMTVGGPDESALGDPVDVLLLEWARQCHKQGGLVVLPHFPNPRAEHAAAIMEGEIDAVEMTSWGGLFDGINPYSLADWYRYLNCGYYVPAVAGTDKMSANTAIGTVRTYARIPRKMEFTYDSWMNAVRAGETFVSYGPLLEFSVEGRPAGARIKMKRNGGTVDVTWQCASVTLPMSRVELIVNGEIRESLAVNAREDAGTWRIHVEKSAWIALLVRGNQPGRREIIAAHSSPVMVEVEGSPFMAAADAITILEQLEGTLAFLNTLATRSDVRTFKRLRLALTSAHRKLHNRMHALGHGHKHTTGRDHPEHGEA